MNVAAKVKVGNASYVIKNHQGGEMPPHVTETYSQKQDLLCIFTIFTDGDDILP